MFVSVGTGIHRLNVKDIAQMYTFMKDLGVTQWRMAVPKPIGRFRKTMSTTVADWNDILEAYRKLIDIHLSEIKLEDGKIKAPINIEIEQVFRTELVVKTMNSFKESDLTCFYHKNRCSLKANGDIVPCGYFDDLITGNVRQDGLKRAWESNSMQQIKQLRISDVVDCRGCVLRHQCGTGCRAVAKHIYNTNTAKDPYACYQAPFLRDIVVPLFKKYGFTLKLSEECNEFADWSIIEQ
jgi:radical SAM protein with 4Fe4S-binding SPASM domain